MKNKIKINYSELLRLVEENTSYEDNQNDDYKYDKGNDLSNTDRVGDVFDTQIPPTNDILDKIRDMGGIVTLDKTDAYDYCIENGYNPMSTNQFILKNKLNGHIMSYDNGEPLIITGLDNAQKRIDAFQYSLTRRNLEPVEVIGFFQPKLNEHYTQSGGQTFWGSMGAGVLPICTTTGRILVAHRSGYVQEPYTWGVWGGKIDEGEGSPKQAALREFNEETQHTGSIKMIDAYIFQKGNFKYYNFIGLLDKEFQPTLNWESSDYKWLTYDELIELGSKHFGLHALLENSGDLIQKYSNINQENELTENIQNNKEIIAYRGTNHKEDFLTNNIFWASSEKRIAYDYRTKFVYELKLNLGNTFNSLKLDDIKQLLNIVGTLVDEYDEVYSMNNIKTFIRLSDTWEPIENNLVAMKWLKENYDSVIISEDSYINYMIFNKKCILNYKEINNG